MGHDLIARFKSLMHYIPVADRSANRHSARKGFTAPQDADNTVWTAMDNGILVDGHDLLPSGGDIMRKGSPIGVLALLRLVRCSVPTTNAHGQVQQTFMISQSVTYQYLN